MKGESVHCVNDRGHTSPTCTDASDDTSLRGVRVDDVVRALSKQSTRGVDRPRIRYWIDWAMNHVELHDTDVVLFEEPDRIRIGDKHVDLPSHRLRQPCEVHHDKGVAPKLRASNEVKDPNLLAQGWAPSLQGLCVVSLSLVVLLLTTDER